MVKNSTFIAAVVTFALALSTVPAHSEQARRVPRVGFLSTSVQTYQDAFRKGLQQLGYIDGENVALEYRFADGNDDRLPELAKQLIASKVDMIVATNSAATRAAMQATRTVPIIMVTSGDPIGAGFIQSFARPGGNVTGLASFVPEQTNKQLELLKEISPRISRVATLWNSANASNISFLSQVQEVSRRLEVTLQPFDVRSLEDLNRSFEKITADGFDGLLAVIDQLTIRHRKRVVHFANERRIPAVYALRQFVVDGGLLSYGVSFTDLHYRAASYVDKILKGTKSSNLPVELPSKFEIAVNLTTAKALGLTIPDTILVRVDETIE